MKNLKRFEEFIFKTNDDVQKINLVNDLLRDQKVYSKDQLEKMSVDQLKSLSTEVSNAEEENDEGNVEPEGLERNPGNFYHGRKTESRNWIKDAIKRPGSLRRKLHKKKGEKISRTQIDSELQALKGKDRDPKKPGTQLGNRDRRKFRQLQLAKTLKGFK